MPAVEETPPSWLPFFDGYAAQAAEGNAIARSLVDRFARPPVGDDDLHEVLITHAYPIAWLVRDALDAPQARWLGLESANAALRRVPGRRTPDRRGVQRDESSPDGVALDWILGGGRDREQPGDGHGVVPPDQG
ncbi:hypothetical protein [Rhodococcus rhodnii]|uniref:Phosphoglycerate mutase n=1 Tax=Rhodococcus rhodnii LMG 5362 TaxID=1273125 RepID=R7WME3_9NOCA|nr:hypothetical protein [Rhodococcus rhodnii]EOM76477.1 hypothetical protein Rrhod_2272 [Rhodococcus rhodnii LMG 5362]